MKIGFKNQTVSDSKNPGYYRTSPQFFRVPNKPTNCSKCLRIRRIVDWNSSNIKKNNCAFCIFIDLNLQKNAKVLTPEDFHTPPKCN